MEGNQRQLLKSNRSDRSLQNAATTIVKLANKKIQQLAMITQAQQNRKYTMVDKVNRLIDRQQHKLKHQQIPKDVQFYQRNMKKFENLSSFINSKGLFSANFSMPKLKVHEKAEETDQEYVDYLLAKNFKLQESRTHRKSSKGKLNYEQCWEMESSYCDFESPVNVDKELFSAHQAQIKKDKDIEAREQERRQTRLFKKGTILEMRKSQRFSQQQLDEDQIMESNLQLNVQHYKEQSDKVIRMIQNAAKKIYNKKEDQIKKEQMMSQIAKKFRQQQREMSKMEINKILASNQKQHLAFATTVRPSQQRTELQETDHYFRKKKQVSRRTNPQPSFSPPCFSEEKSRGQNNILNSKIHDIVNRIDNIQVGDQDQAIRKMQNEQIFYQTLRETLQQDQIKDTLKGLFLPMDHLQRRRLQYNKKHFQNQIL